MPRLHNAPPPAPTPIGDVWLEDGIMHHRIHPETTITASLAHRTVDSLADYAGGRKRPAVVDIRGVTFADREARDVFADDLEFETATALVVDSNLSKNIGNLYLRLSRPSRPTRLFVSPDEATQWAKEFIS